MVPLRTHILLRQESCHPSYWAEYRHSSAAAKLKDDEIARLEAALEEKKGPEAVQMVRDDSQLAEALAAADAERKKRLAAEAEAERAKVHQKLQVGNLASFDSMLDLDWRHLGNQVCYFQVLQTDRQD